MVRLKCYLNGVFVLMPWAEAHRKLWEVSFGWVVPGDWCRWQLSRFEGERSMSPGVLASTKEFLLPLLSRTTPYSRTEFVERFPKLEESKDNTFSQRAHRVKDIITKEAGEKNPLVQHVPLVHLTEMRELAYRVREGITTLVIVESAGDSQNLSWAELLIPPGPKAGDNKQDREPVRRPNAA